LLAALDQLVRTADLATMEALEQRVPRFSLLLGLPRRGGGDRRASSASLQAGSASPPTRPRTCARAQHGARGK
jgi:hypothetical protein